MAIRSFFAGLTAGLVAALLVLSAGSPATAVTPHASPQSRFLVLYAGAGPYGRLGEIYAVFTANLLGRFGPSDIEPIERYRSGQIAAHRAVVYVGASYIAEPPTAFLREVLDSTGPVLWIQHGADQLARTDPGFGPRMGWAPAAPDLAPRTAVRYGGRVFGRRSDAGPLPGVRVLDTARARIVATAEGEGAPPVPWAVQSGRFLYVAEAPYAYMDPDSRYVAFAGLLSDWLAPEQPVRRRALLRIEDVGPEADPKRLRALADRLKAEGVPFVVTVYDSYRDPLGRYSGGSPVAFTLRDRPEVVRALAYMQTQGAGLVMHGHTHQTDLRNNPYARVSGGDFEFYGAHAKADGGVVLDGPLAGDQEEAWLRRIDDGLRGWASAGLARPWLFTTPHYAASPAAYAAFARRFQVRYENVLYFPGETLGRVDATAPQGQFFPYPVRDIRGSVILPENLGRLAGGPAGVAGGRTPEQILGSAERNLALREAWASFYAHWYLDPDEVVRTVRGVKAMGYVYVAPEAAARELGAAPPAVVARPPPPRSDELSLGEFLAVIAGLLGMALLVGVLAARRAIRRR